MIGAASGIGLATARALAAEGANVVIADLEEVKLSATSPPSSAARTARLGSWST